MSQPSFFSASLFNKVWNASVRIEPFVNYITTQRFNELVLDERPVDEEFRRRVAQALTSSAHITEIWLSPDPFFGAADVTVRDVIQWLTTSTPGQTPTATLACFTNLTTMNVNGIYDDRSLEDWELVFPLLLTSTSLQELHLRIQLKGDRVMRALAQYLRAATRVSLREFSLSTTCSLSEADFASLCDGFAGSQLRKLHLDGKVAEKAYLETETAAESLARAISITSLEEVKLGNKMWLALFHNLVTANIPLGLLPQILEKAHTVSEPSSCSPRILFDLLRENPNLVMNGECRMLVP
jgi:hypothetical protein